MSETLQTGKSIYGNFWYRVLAVLIDAIFVVLIGIVVSLPFKSMFTESVDFELVKGAINMFIAVIYGAIAESSKWQGGFGKKALSLKVTNIEGDALNLSEALTRNLLKNWTTVIIVIAAYATGMRPPESDEKDGMAVLANPYIQLTFTLTLFYTIGCVMAAFTARRQAIHDIIAKTAVLTSKTKSSGTDEEW